MKAIFIDIAVDTAASNEQRQALQVLRGVVAAYEKADASFGERINASKAKRGEAPTRLTPAKQQLLAAFERDLLLPARHSGISNQLPIARQQLKFYHPDDLSIGTDRLDKHDAMATAIGQFLQCFPGDMDAEGLE